MFTMKESRINYNTNLGKELVIERVLDFVAVSTTGSILRLIAEASAPLSGNSCINDIFFNFIYSASLFSDINFLKNVKERIIVGWRALVALATRITMTKLIHACRERFSSQ